MKQTILAEAEDDQAPDEIRRKGTEVLRFSLMPTPRLLEVQTVEATG